MENLLCADTFLFPEWKLDKLRRSTEFGGAIHIFFCGLCCAPLWKNKNKYLSTGLISRDRCPMIQSPLLNLFCLLPPKGSSSLICGLSPLLTQDRAFLSSISLKLSPKEDISLWIWSRVFSFTSELVALAFLCLERLLFGMFKLFISSDMTCL